MSPTSAAGGGAIPESDSVGCCRWVSKLEFVGRVNVVVLSSVLAVVVISDDKTLEVVFWKIDRIDDVATVVVVVFNNMLDFSEPPLQFFSRADAVPLMVAWPILVIIFRGDGVDSEVIGDDEVVEVLARWTF